MDEKKVNVEELPNIFLITCFTKCEKDANGFFDGGSQRSFGYRYSFELAEEALNLNICDMHETIYHYAVVEELPPCIHPCPPDSEVWFKWDAERKGFFRIEKPEATQGFCNFGAIG